MKRIFALLLLLWAFATTATAQESIRVRIRTEVGNIDIELYPGRAPGTVENFLRYVAGGFYEGGRFHRTVKLDNQPNNDVLIEVIQAGVNPERRGESFDPIPLERTNVTGLRHEDGAISMARGGPNSARSDIFICIEDQPSLDFGGDRNADGQGFAAFGKVVDGMDVVRAIQAAPADAQSLTPPVGIISIERLQ
jgi:peptidyl-prolyl cis-trans isomerase A (cyclophilin A)